MPIAPHIGGEPEAYLEAQLMAFKTGQREHEMMTVVTAGLDAQQISDVAAWYGAHEATAILPEGVKAEDAPQACVSCHGADGISELLDAPNLAGRRISTSTRNSKHSSAATDSTRSRPKLQPNCLMRKSGRLQTGMLP
ncbi:c-type cytochrome [Sulfitobacter sediminilitoris]|uniref:c-type cytochrome n=1 Tax=Sulfitobacter sediminilitoris TaxID=2698830 RepID=UPI003607FBAB